MTPHKRKRILKIQERQRRPILPRSLYCDREADRAIYIPVEVMSDVERVRRGERVRGHAL